MWFRGPGIFHLAVQPTTRIEVPKVWSRPATSPGSLWERYILRFHPRPVESETQVGRRNLGHHTHPRDSSEVAHVWEPLLRVSGALCFLPKGEKWKVCVADLMHHVLMGCRSLSLPFHWLHLLQGRLGFVVRVPQKNKKQAVMKSLQHGACFPICKTCPKMLNHKATVRLMDWNVIWLLA